MENIYIEDVSQKKDNKCKESVPMWMQSEKTEMYSIHMESQLLTGGRYEKKAIGRGACTFHDNGGFRRIVDGQRLWCRDRDRESTAKEQRRQSGARI